MACVAYGCTNKKTKNLSDVSYHQFPRDETLKKFWIKAIDRKGWQPIHSSFVCSDHFNPKDIKRISCFKTILRDGAVPCLFKKRPNDHQEKTTNLGRGAESEESYKNPFDDDDADSPLSTPPDFFPVLSSDSDTSQNCMTLSQNNPTLMFPKIPKRNHKILSAGVHTDSVSSVTELSQETPVTANVSCSASSVTPSNNCVPMASTQVLDSSSTIHYSHIFYKASFERKIRNMKFENFESQREVRKLQTKRRKLEKELDKVFSVIVSLHRNGCLKTGVFEKMETDYKLHARKPELDLYELTKL